MHARHKRDTTFLPDKSHPEERRAKNERMIRNALKLIAVVLLRTLKS